VVPPSHAGADRPAPTSPAPSSPAPIRLLAGALLSSDLGAMPEPALGLTASVAIANPFGRIELAGTYWFDQHGAAASRPSTGGDFSFVSAAALLCPTLVHGVVELSACAGIELGRMHAVGTGVRDSAEETLLWLAARAGGTGTWRLARPFGLRLELGAAVPFMRPRWVLGRGTVYEVDRPAALDARASLGGELRF